MKIVYDVDTLQCMTLFEQVTGTQLKDCQMGERIVFIVQQGQIHKAIGKGAVHAKKLEALLKKKIRIVEFNPELLQFIRNLIYPSQVRTIEEKEGIVTIAAPDSQTRGILIGKGAANLRAFEGLAKRFFPVLKEIKIT